MSGYTKLSHSIVGSTVWRESAPTRLVWITMLALADQHGEVMVSVPGLADFARVSLPECEEALRVLSSPDFYSRTKDHEGRRIVEIDGGWEILNHKKYRELYSDEDKRKHTAERVRRYRERNAVTPDVTLGNAGNGKQKQKQKKELQQPDPTAEEWFERVWSARPRRPNDSKADARKAFLASLKRGASPQAILDGIVRYAAFCAQGGVSEPKYIKQTATFLGPGEWWLSDYTPPEVPVAPPSPYDLLAQEAADVSAYLA